MPPNSGQQNASQFAQSLDVTARVILLTTLQAAIAFGKDALSRLPSELALRYTGHQLDWAVA